MLSGRTSRSARPGCSIPRNPSLTSSSPGSTPWRRAKPAAARSRICLRRALDPGRLGPLGKVVEERRQPARADEELRGLAVRSARRRASGAGARPRSRRRRAAPRSRSQAAGVGICSFLQLQVELRRPARDVADAGDPGRPLGHADRATRLEQVERVRELQHLVVCRQRETAFEQVAALGLVLVEAAQEDVDRRLLEVVDRPLAFVLLEHLAPRDAGRPLELEGALSSPGRPSRAGRGRR